MEETTISLNTRSPTDRLVALDWMRGLVIVLMTVDHVSGIFNRHTVSVDSFAFDAAGASLYIEAGNPIHFLTRWITHLCAPSFVFLAGAALALSTERRIARGESAFAIDRHLLCRGLLLIGIEIWMSLSSMFPVVEVLYAIGASIVVMILLRRLPTLALFSIAIAWIAVGEWITQSFGLMPIRGGEPSVSCWGGLLFTNGLYETPFNIPAIGWMPLTTPLS